MPIFKPGKGSAPNTKRPGRDEQPPSSASPPTATIDPPAEPAFHLPERERSSTASLPVAPVDTLPETALDGAASFSSSDYASKSREVMALYWALLDLHAGTVFDLPRVVVIGGQSSGKSSLVEAVTGINVPRDSGTCTRCPMVCTMSSNARSWSCTVSLRRDFDQNGNPLVNPRIEPFGGVIENPAAVELQIRRAQAAILGPHRPAADFYDMNVVELRENVQNDKSMLLFSRNVVQVEVKDPKATDLTFVDLPGLIQNAEDPSLIRLVRELTEDYIRKKNTLIVIAMPMSDDIQNIQAVTLAKHPRVDPRKERTIGVITKPDTLSPGSTGIRETWKAILEGRQIEHVTKHGYYCVRLPDDAERERKISRVEAENLASTFFASSSPWSGMDDRSRFGIPNFVKDISELLIELIERNLPELRKTVEKELAQCIRYIEALPPVLDLKDPSTEVMLRISDFCKDIKDAVFGRNREYFVQLNKERYSKFKDDIQMTTPDFRPVENIDSSRYTAVRSRCQPRGLAEVRNVIKGSITWELPGHVPFEATKRLILQYTSLWKDPSMRCFQDVVAKTDQLLDKLLSDHFGRFKELEQYMRTLTLKERDIHREETGKVLEKLLCREIDPLYTQNFEALQAEKRTWSAKYGQYPHERSNSSSDPWFSPHYSVVHQFPKKMFSHIPDGGRSSHDELEVMANVQAYFQVAHKRIIDYVPLTVEHELNQAFAQAIDKTLFAAVSKDTERGEVTLRDLLREDPVIERKREELKERKSRLLQIKENLDNFRQSSSSKLGLSAYEEDLIPETSDWLDERVPERTEPPEHDAMSMRSVPFEFPASRSASPVSLAIRVTPQWGG